MCGMNVCLSRPRSSASMTLIMMLTWSALSAYGGRLWGGGAWSRCEWRYWWNQPRLRGGWGKYAERHDVVKLMSHVVVDALGGDVAFHPAPPVAGIHRRWPEHGAFRTADFACAFRNFIATFGQSHVPRLLVALDGVWVGRVQSSSLQGVVCPIQCRRSRKLQARRESS